jgi:effector-binding domain-containing protein
MISEPKLSDRTEQHYVAIRTQVPQQELGTVIPQLIEEVFAWLTKQGVAPAGAPFIRYHAINQTMTSLDVELGEQVATPLLGQGQIHPGILPAGRYATLTYTGPKNGLQANATLIAWGAKQGLVWDSWAVENDEGFGGRFEFFLTGPAREPDPEKWETEVAIRLADHQPR